MLGAENHSGGAGPACQTGSNLVSCSVPSRTLGGQLCPALPVSPWRDLPPPAWELFLPPRPDRTSLLGRYTSRRGTPCPCLQVSPSLRRGLLFPGPSDPRLPPRLSKQAALQGCSVPIVPNHASAVPERGATQRLGPVCVPQGTVAPPAGLVSSHLAPPYPHPAPHCAQGTRTQVHAQVSARWYTLVSPCPPTGASPTHASPAHQ